MAEFVTPKPGRGLEKLAREYDPFGDVQRQRGIDNDARR
jgi:hypothetical protein